MQGYLFNLCSGAWVFFSELCLSISHFATCSPTLGGGGLVFGLESQWGWVNTVAFPCGSWSIIKQVSQMSSTLKHNGKIFMHFWHFSKKDVTIYDSRQVDFTGELLCQSLWFCYFLLYFEVLPSCVMCCLSFPAFVWFLAHFHCSLLSHKLISPAVFVSLSVLFPSACCRVMSLSLLFCFRCFT